MLLNARTDAFWSGTDDVADALKRPSAYRNAGADRLFVPGLTEPHLNQVVALGLPTNAL